MAIFTALSRDDADRLLDAYDLGPTLALEGIGSGIENTNYFLDTPRGRWVLTVFERLRFEELPFFLELMRHLARRGLPVPEPVAGRDGALLRKLKGKPAAIVDRRPGAAVLDPGPAHCAAVGAFLARMHLEARDAPLRQPHARGAAWWRTVLPELADHVPAHSFRELVAEVELQSGFSDGALCRRLPAGPIHADLFRDNVLFEPAPAAVPEAGVAPRIGGVIDFYFAGCDTWLFDLAVTVNDWCVHPGSGEIDPQRCHALLGAYHVQRPLGADEAEAWPLMLRAAALRFWISRLHDLHLPRPAQLLVPHDPAHFERMWRLRAERRDPPWIEG